VGRDVAHTRAPPSSRFKHIDFPEVKEDTVFKEKSHEWNSQRQHLTKLLFIADFLENFQRWIKTSPFAAVKIHAIKNAPVFLITW
jgi:hypothetical protein